MTEFEKLMLTPWGDSLRLGIDKSITNGITLSVFKGIGKEIFPKSDFENDDWDEEDFWTMRFENWCVEIMKWKEDYPVNRSTCFNWCEDYVKDFDHED